MGLVVGTTMALIGLHNAWLIGLLFGILEFIPNLGPTIASVPTVLIAFIDGSTILNISNGWFAVLVIGVNFALQQLENNFLVPRIMGQSLNLHPLVVLIAALIGAQMAGVLGILLAAPVVATLRVLAEYAYYRLLDMPPFPEQRVPSAPEIKDEVAVKEDEPSTLQAQPATASEAEQAK
jgi:predicted PurR-regulated permease PerM